MGVRNKTPSVQGPAAARRCARASALPPSPAAPSAERPHGFWVRSCPRTPSDLRASPSQLVAGPDRPGLLIPTGGGRRQRPGSAWEPPGGAGLPHCERVNLCVLRHQVHGHESQRPQKLMQPLPADAEVPERGEAGLGSERRQGRPCRVEGEWVKEAGGVRQGQTERPAGRRRQACWPLWLLLLPLVDPAPPQGQAPIGPLESCLSRQPHPLAVIRALGQVSTGFCP